MRRARNLSPRPGHGFDGGRPVGSDATIAKPRTGSARQSTAGGQLTIREGGSGAVPSATLVATVKWHDPVKECAFLTPAHGSCDLSCHVSAVGRAGLLTLAEGVTVTCEVEQGRQGPQVERIHTVDTSTASSVPTVSGRPIYM